MEYLDLLAISTCADIVPITGENRVFVYHGLKVINESPRLGVKTLIDLSDKKKDLTSTDVVFTIAPRINAAGRIETGNKAVEFQDMANATLNNTSSFATKFLETIACNRAFVRCVRNFLNVHIVGDDEIDKSNNKSFSGQSNSSPSLTPHSMIENLAKEKLNCSSFEEFKVYLRDWWKDGKYKNDSVKEWNDFSDIPATQARVLMKVMND